MYMLMYISVMPHSYSIAEARSSLPTIIDQAEAGLEIELTRRGKPVAVLVSFRKFERLRAGRPRFGDVYRNFLKKHSLDEVGLEDDFVASTREKGAGREVSL
jgi:prevent-host-death family protein